MKTCTRCKKQYDDDKFLTKFNKICTSCEYCREKKREERKLRDEHRIDVKVGEKKCIKCNIIYKKEDFINENGNERLFCNKCKKITL
jgi:recombinational DNA repair protein (RecF pathway)